VEHQTAAELASLVGAAGACTVLIGRGRTALVGGIALLALAEAGLAYALVPPDDLGRLVASPARSALLALAGALVAGLGAALARFPAVVPVALLAVAPFRVPVELGAQKAFLLVPLYAVLAASVLALTGRALAGKTVRAIPLALSVPAALFVAISSISLLWSQDVRAGTIVLLFFLFPFTALVAVVARSPFAAWLPKALAVGLVSVGLALAAVGIWQLWSGRLFFARDLEVANVYTSYFRTTSLFADSSVYGRHLVLAIVAVLAALWMRRVRPAVGLPVTAALWIGLFFSYSQSSMAALLVAGLALALIAADRVGRRILVVGMVAFAFAAAGLVAVMAHDQSAQRFTSGRSRLVESSARVFAKHPLAGVGLGAQPRASRAEPGSRRAAARNASHTTALTVAAELGLVGLAAYVAFLAGGARLLVAAYRLRPEVGLALTGAFLALFVHSLLYSGFFQDPFAWGVLAVAALCLRSEPTPSPAASPLRDLLRTASLVRERWQTRFSPVPPGSGDPNLCEESSSSSPSASACSSPGSRRPPF
jgi:hypothetical protein